jgi:flavin prenyltransferase
MALGTLQRCARAGNRPKSSVIARVIIAMTGASGALYFVRTMRALLLGGHAVELVVSKHARFTLEDETAFGDFAGTIPEWLCAELGDSVRPDQIRMHQHNDQTSPIASGSNVADGMIVIPCTAKTLAGIAHGYATNLIERSADVILKERRPLVLVFREAPYSLIHLRNLTAASEAGAAILPASPAFYQKPETFDDLGDFIAQRALALVGIEVDLFDRWLGPKPKR